MSRVVSRWEVETKPASMVSSAVVRVKQMHGNAIVWAEEAQAGGIVADGIAAHHEFTRSFMINTADCLPLVVATEAIICAIHVSRKTLTGGILDRVPDFIKPESIVAVWIGPHICVNHFVFEWVGQDVAAFQARFPSAYEEREDGIHLSNLAATLGYLESWGVPTTAIQRDTRCTYEDDSLQSYRRGLHGREKLSGGIATIVTAKPFY